MPQINEYSWISTSMKMMIALTLITISLNFKHSYNLYKISKLNLVTFKILL